MELDKWYWDYDETPFDLYRPLELVENDEGEYRIYFIKEGMIKYYDACNIIAEGSHYIELLDILYGFTK